MELRKWKNVLIVDNEKDAILVSAREKLGGVNQEMTNIYPVTIELPKERTKIGAMIRSYEYSKMGIFNLICKRG